MRAPGLFHIQHRPPIASGQLRLTRLNIYSGLYLEWARCRVLIDPAKVPLQAAPHLHPDLILVSHESMDHFDASQCARLLEDPHRHLIGSWAVVLAFADHLSPDDVRWARILPGIPGHCYQVGDLAIAVHRSIHCEYAAPLIFEITDATSGFRLVDAIDTAITPEMQTGAVRPRPDLLIAPAGIALGVSPETAWEMTRLLDPRIVIASHLTRERAQFVALASDRPSSTEQVFAPEWHEAVILDAGDPHVPSPAQVRVTATSRALESITAITDATAIPSLLDLLDTTSDRDVLVHGLYAVSCALRCGHPTSRVNVVLRSLRERVLAAEDEPLLAAWLLAWGVCLRASEDAAAADLDDVAHLLSPQRAYVGYWVLECWGRAGGNPRLADSSRARLAAVAADAALWNTVGLRRKVMWEVERLVRSNTSWPGLPALLRHALSDANPDVRLLAFRILPLIEVPPVERWTLLGAGLSDPHEDVLEEAIAAHIALFHTLTDDERNAARARRSLLETGPTFQVRERANVLAEMLSAPVDHPAATPAVRAIEAGVGT